MIMRKKVIIAMIIAAVVAVGALGGAVVHSSNNKNKNVKVLKNETAAKKVAENNEILAKKEVENIQKEEEKKKADEKKNTTIASSQEQNSKPKAQTLEEGYDLCSKMWNEYNDEHFDEAVRLYEAITNKDAIAKIGTDKIRIYHGQKMNQEIAKAQGYYNSGDYVKAKVYIREIINGNFLMPGQKQKAELIFDNARTKISPEDQKKADEAFTNERAVQLIKEKVGCNPHDTFSDFTSYEDPYMGKVINVVLHKNGDPHNVVFYKVTMDGNVVEPD